MLSRIVSVAAFALLLLGQAAKADSFNVKGQVKLSFAPQGQPIPKISIEAGSSTRDVPADMLTDQLLDISFSSEEPKEFKATIIQKWEDENITTMPLSFAPLDIGKASTIPIFRVRGGLIPSNYDEVRLEEDSRKYCLGSDEGTLPYTKQFVACSGIFALYKQNSAESKVAAIRSFRGWFDAYYQLRVSSESFLARNAQVEDQARQFETLAQNNSAVRNNFEAVGIRPGYFNGMIKNLDDDGIRVFNSIREHIRRRTEQEALQQAKVAVEILANTHEKITSDLAAEGTKTTIVNGLRFDEIKKTRSNHRPQAFLILAKIHQAFSIEAWFH